MKWIDALSHFLKRTSNGLTIYLHINDFSCLRKTLAIDTQIVDAIDKFVYDVIFYDIVQSILLYLVVSSSVVL